MGLYLYSPAATDIRYMYDHMLKMFDTLKVCWGEQPCVIILTPL